MFGEHKLLTEGAQAEGVILEWHAGNTRSTVRLVVGIAFDDGEKVQFSESMTDYCKVPARNVKERFDPDVVPLTLIEGEKIPVRYDPEKRSRAVIDTPALYETAIRNYLAGEKYRREQAEQKLVAQHPAGAPAQHPAGAPGHHPLPPPHNAHGPLTHEADALDLLAKAAALHASGVLSDAEFDAEKRKLLSSS